MKTTIEEIKEVYSKVNNFLLELLNSKNNVIYTDPKITEFKIGTSKGYLGKIYKGKNNIFTLEISKTWFDNFKDDNVREKQLISTIAHELVHTISGCFDHGDKFKIVGKTILDKTNGEINILSLGSWDDLYYYYDKNNKMIFGKNPNEEKTKSAKKNNKIEEGVDVVKVEQERNEVEPEEEYTYVKKKRIFSEDWGPFFLERFFFLILPSIPAWLIIFITQFCESYSHRFLMLLWIMLYMGFLVVTPMYVIGKAKEGSDGPGVATGTAFGIFSWLGMQYFPYNIFGYKGAFSSNRGAGIVGVLLLWVITYVFGVVIGLINLFAKLVDDISYIFINDDKRVKIVKKKIKDEATTSNEKIEKGDFKKKLKRKIHSLWKDIKENSLLVITICASLLFVIISLYVCGFLTVTILAFVMFGIIAFIAIIGFKKSIDHFWISILLVFVTCLSYCQVYEGLVVERQDMIYGAKNIIVTLEEPEQLGIDDGKYVFKTNYHITNNCKKDIVNGISFWVYLVDNEGNEVLNWFFDSNNISIDRGETVYIDTYSVKTSSLEVYNNLSSYKYRIQISMVCFEDTDIFYREDKPAGLKGY